MANVDTVATMPLNAYKSRSEHVSAEGFVYTWDEKNPTWYNFSDYFEEVFAMRNMRAKWIFSHFGRKSITHIHTPVAKVPKNSHNVRCPCWQLQQCKILSASTALESYIFYELYVFMPRNRDLIEKQNLHAQMIVQTLWYATLRMHGVYVACVTHKQLYTARHCWSK